MISASYKIIAVDNEESELDKIFRVFSELRVACLPVLYNIGDLMPVKFAGIRLAFFDLNLGPGSPGDSDLCNIVSQALKNIIDKKNGPYALIIWSLHADKLPVIKQYIEEREKDNIPSPILVDSIDKVQVVDNPAKLKAEIRRVLSNSTLTALFDYENMALQAATDSMNSLFDLIPKGSDKWGEHTDFDKNFDIIFSRMAVNATEREYARNNPKGSIKKALSPILVHNINNLNLDDSWNTLLTKFDSKLPKDLDVGRLNTAYHITDLKKLHKDIRGVVTVSNLGTSYKPLFGKTKREIFEYMFDIDPSNSKIDLSKVDEFYKKCEFVFLEISASCDYANRKPRVLKYMLGIEHPYPIDLYKEGTKKSDKKDAVNQSFISTPVFLIKNQNRAVKFNLRFVLGLNAEYEKIGKVKYKLNDNIVDMISNSYSSFVSRIGIVSFENGK